MTTESDLREAVAKIEVDGVELDVTLLKGLRIDQVADGPAYFEFSVSDQSEEAPTNFPDDSLAIGAEIKISLGYEEADTVLFEGKVTRIDGVFHESDAPHFVISGFDPAHELTRGRFTKQFQEQKYSDVASAIIGDAGLSASADSTDVTMPWISMTNQTRLGFLQHLARRVGFEVRYDIDSGNVLFAKPKTGEAAVATFTYGEGLKRAKFRAQTAGQMTKVIVKANSDKDDKTITGESTESDVTDKLGGSTTGPAVASGIWGDAEYWITGYAATTQAEVDEVAKAVMNEIAYEFITGEAELEGDVTVFAGKVVTMDGCSDPFSGDYYIIRAVHAYDVGGGPNKGYRTLLTLRRPAWSV